MHFVPYGGEVLDFELSQPFVGNYGVAIIVFTFLFYSLLFPLRWKQSKSFKKAAGNAPKMKEIQDKIKALQKKGVPMDDPKMRQLQMEQLKLTKDALPIGGCLPMLVMIAAPNGYGSTPSAGIENPPHPPRHPPQPRRPT